MMRMDWECKYIFYFIFIFVSGCAFTKVVVPSNTRLDPDGKTLWYNCAQLKVDGKGWVDTEVLYDRLPKKARACFKTKIILTLRY